MVKLPTLSDEVVQTSSETTCEVHVRSAVDECEKNDSTSLLVCVVQWWCCIVHRMRALVCCLCYARLAALSYS
jgi:hypothetical protein